MGIAVLPSACPRQQQSLLRASYSERAWACFYLFPHFKRRASLFAQWAKVLSFWLSQGKLIAIFTRKLSVSNVILYTRYIKSLVLFPCVHHNLHLAPAETIKRFTLESTVTLNYGWSKTICGPLWPPLLLPAARWHLKVRPVVPSKYLLLLLLCSKALCSGRCAHATSFSLKMLRKWEKIFCKPTTVFPLNHILVWSAFKCGNVWCCGRNKGCESRVLNLYVPFFFPKFLPDLR